MMNLEKNFCPNYQWKTVTQVMVWKNSYRSASVSWTSFAPQKKKTGNNMPFMIKLLLRQTEKEVICDID